MTSEQPAVPWRKRLGRRKRALAIAVLLPVGLCLTASVVAWLEARAVERRWARDVVSFDDVLARHPEMPANAAARRLQELAAKLDVDLEPRRHGRVSRHAPPIKAALSEYMESERASEAGVPGPAPDSVVAWLAAHDVELRAVVDALADGETPAWEVATSRGHERPIPNMLGVVTLQKLLAAAAMDAARGGRDDEALRIVHAAWALNASLREHPELISSLIAAAMARVQLSVLRKVAYVPVEWDARIAEHDSQGSLEDALAIDAWSWMDHARRHGLVIPEWPPVPPLPSERLKGFLLRPLARHQVARASDRLRADILVARETAPCRPRLPLSRPTTSSFLADWLGDLGPGRLTMAHHRVARLTYDWELTRQVLLARRERVDGNSSGPCSRWKFVRKLEPDGLMSVTCSGCPVPHDSPDGLEGAWTWSEGPPEVVADTSREVEMEHDVP